MISNDIMRNVTVIRVRETFFGECVGIRVFVSVISVDL